MTTTLSAHPIPPGCAGKACNFCGRDSTREIAQGSTFPWHDGRRILHHTAERAWQLCCLHYAAMVHGGCDEAER